ncbi:MAG: class I SAM-dependent methyltransferase [Lachnospiraceae bacterium]|nr:class I SAM-dependent methyltransferase [Lachnospiraceae bacterium]
MWVADNWKDYEVLDTSSGEKLERWGDYFLVRPDPQVIWNTEKKNKYWTKFDGHYHRSKEGGGSWENRNIPEEGWSIGYKDLTFNLKPFAFKHTGLFPEQAVNWDFVRGLIENRLDEQAKEGKTLEEREVKVLNLFAYTGGATLACAKSGAKVTHVDASKGMVGWAKENAVASGLQDAPIRYIVDDCLKFVEREIRRGNLYDGIIMDPPSYGRGPNGEVWKIEEKIHELLEVCTKVMKDKPLFLILNSYTTGLQPAVLSYLINITFGKKFGGKVEASEIGLPLKDSNLVLPCGATGRWVNK